MLAARDARVFPLLLDTQGVRGREREMEEMRGGGRMAVFTETGLYSLVSKLGGQPVSPSCYAHARLRLARRHGRRGGRIVEIFIFQSCLAEGQV